MLIPLVLSVLLGVAAGDAGDALKLPLRVLYAGNAGTPYTDTYRRFFEEHAQSVRTLSLSEFRTADLADVDVLVIGGEVEELDSDGKLKGLKGEKIGFTLDDLQGFPVVLVGGQGGFVSDSFKLKTSWQYG